MYTGDEYYGDDITSPLVRPAPAGSVNPLVTIYVEAERYEEFIAGTDGNVEWLDDRCPGWCRLLVTTDVPSVLIERFDADDNVLSYEVCQGDEADEHRSRYA